MIPPDDIRFIKVVGVVSLRPDNKIAESSDPQFKAWFVLDFPHHGRPVLFDGQKARTIRGAQMVRRLYDLDIRSLMGLEAPKEYEFSVRPQEKDLATKALVHWVKANLSEEQQDKGDANE